MVGLRPTCVAVLTAACLTCPWIGSKVEAQAVAAPPSAEPESATAAPEPGAIATPPSPATEIPRAPVEDWLRQRLPPAARLDRAANGELDVLHTAASGETALTIATAYLDVTDVYRAHDLAAAIAKRYPDLRPGTVVRIPHVLSAPYATPDADRMAWPADRVLKGIYITGPTAAQRWPEILDRVQASRLNAIVLDAKAYAGPITYPTHVQLALDSGAGTSPSIRDFSRTIRFAHARGVYVIARLACFNDPWTAAHVPRLSIRSKSGGASAVGWIDPANAEVQDYLVDLVKEVVDLGADEIELDYVRFPVEGTGDAAMLKADGHRSRAIASFVGRVHEVTETRGVPLSLDVFGVAGSAPRSDIETLGQDLLLLGPVAEAISPMVYPSHYPVGTFGFDQPGDHPELVGFGTKATVTKLTSHQATGPIVRPWLQAASFRTTEFGPKYIKDEIRSAEAGGAVGWLLWDAGNNYWAVWSALSGERAANPPVKDVTASR